MKGCGPTRDLRVEGVARQVYLESKRLTCSRSLGSQTAVRLKGVLIDEKKRVKVGVMVAANLRTC